MSLLKRITENEINKLSQPGQTSINKAAESNDILNLATHTDINTFPCSVKATQLLKQNNNRVAYIIINPTTINVYVWFTNAVSSTNGIELAANGGMLNLTLREDFSLTTNALYVIAASGTPTISTVEVIKD